MSRNSLNRKLIEIYRQIEWLEEFKPEQTCELKKLLNEASRIEEALERFAE